MGSRRRKKKPERSPAERVCSVGRLQRQLWPSLEIIKRMAKGRNPGGGGQLGEVTKGIGKKEN